MYKVKKMRILTRAKNKLHLMIKSQLDAVDMLDQAQLAIQYARLKLQP